MQQGTRAQRTWSIVFSLFVVISLAAILSQAVYGYLLIAQVNLIPSQDNCWVPGAVVKIERIAGTPSKTNVTITNVQMLADKVKCPREWLGFVTFGGNAVCYCTHVHSEQERLEQLWGGHANKLIIVRAIPLGFVFFLIAHVVLVTKSWRVLEDASRGLIS